MTFIAIGVGVLVAVVGGILYSRWARPSGLDETEHEEWDIQRISRPPQYLNDVDSTSSSIALSEAMGWASPEVDEMAKQWLSSIVIDEEQDKSKFRLEERQVTSPSRPTHQNESVYQIGTEWNIHL